MQMDEALPTFIAESRELLHDMESALLGVLELDERQEAINAIFRAAHTIKGSAGLFGLDAIVGFTHVMESVLDRVREGELALDEPLVQLLLSCADHLAGCIRALAAGQAEPDEAARARPLQQRLQAYLGAEAGATPVAVPEAGAQAAQATTAGDWRIALGFGPDVLRNGMDPLSFVRYLQRLGELRELRLDRSRVPALEQLDPEACYLDLSLVLHTDADRASIEGTFEFVREDCRIEIVPPADGPQAGPSQPEPAEGIERIEAAAPTDTARPAEARKAEGPLIRVDADKLDQLIDLVGELVTASASATLAARATHHTVLQECNAALAGLIDEVRDCALQLRMVRIGSTFARFRRVVHDVSREIGKNIVLELHGEDTELDKTVVEKIADPLTHLVRNAMDHGIEPAALRLSRGKPETGTVTLDAYHDSGQVVIEVSDDGGGLDSQRILAKAVERGLVEAGRNLGEAEIFALIFEPGFSTAEQVSNLSGRGVGMDVVKRNIDALRGSVSLASTPGRGTTVRIRLPLTLALIDGFQVGVGRSVFVVPLESVVECIEYREEGGSGPAWAELRGKVLPFIRLRTLFEVGGMPPARQNIVVVRHAGQQFGLLVDTLYGEFQTVIKPLSPLFSQVRGISGSSIRGSGDVALILDVASLAEQAESGQGAAART
ncbi:chemotaxis protein CheA [Xylophilus rhododendri]|uniref:Chemotaxis protein CheA n=1 Tax=Xylophilus rhododendri TaxID=2697032 RepID=A0A857J0V2_9BURK|nr:chemotaxis protein CheA [Xylophilus rhododendri]QHI97504.1 chemotaxis protein CheA [Xylophilus rhododendri]